MVRLPVGVRVPTTEPWKDSLSWSLSVDIRDPVRGGCTTLKSIRYTKSGGSSPRAPHQRRAQRTSACSPQERGTGDGARAYSTPTCI